MDKDTIQKLIVLLDMDENTIQKVIGLLDAELMAQKATLQGLYESDAWHYEDLEYERGHLAGIRYARDLLVKFGS